MENISHHSLVLSHFSLSPLWTNVTSEGGGILGVVVAVSCSDTVHRMRQLWFLDCCLFLGGWYSLGRSKSLSIGSSQSTWWYTFLGTSWFHLRRLRTHMIYLIPCGLLCCTFPVHSLIWMLQIVCSTLHDALPIYLVGSYAVTTYKIDRKSVV